MFRPTHFVILFAVVLYANAFPADPLSKAPDTLGKVEAQGGAIENVPSILAAAKPAADKADLETDATVHWGYKYYGPRWGYGPGRTIGWGFGIARDYNVVPPYYLY